jgi:hypothetical protein
MEEDQTTQWPNETVQQDKQRSTKYTHKTKDRVTRTPLKSGVELLETLSHKQYGFTLMCMYKYQQLD